MECIQWIKLETFLKVVFFMSLLGFVYTGSDGLAAPTIAIAFGLVLTAAGSVTRHSLGFGSSVSRIVIRADIRLDEPEDGTIYLSDGSVYAKFSAILHSDMDGVYHSYIVDHKYQTSSKFIQYMNDGEYRWSMINAIVTIIGITLFAIAPYSSFMSFMGFVSACMCINTFSNAHYMRKDMQFIEKSLDYPPGFQAMTMGQFHKSSWKRKEIV